MSSGEILKIFDNILETIKNRLVYFKELEKKNISVKAFRLDSGDLNALSNKVRSMLDAAGLKDVKIMATNELTEQIIADLKHRGAKIDLWGVGTNLVTAKDQPALDGVYKLCAVQGTDKQWKYCLKISEQVIL